MDGGVKLKISIHAFRSNPQECLSWKDMQLDGRVARELMGKSWVQFLASIRAEYARGGYKVLSKVC